MKKYSVKKIVSCLIIATMLSGEAAFLALPREVQAQSFLPPVSVPTWTYGGHTDAVSKVGEDSSVVWSEVMRAGLIAASNSAISFFAKKLNARLQKLLGIKSQRQYQAALVEAKYLVEAYADYFGEETVKVGPPVTSTGTCEENPETSASSGEGMCSNDNATVCTVDADCTITTTQRADHINTLATDAEGDYAGLSRSQVNALAVKEAKSADSAAKKKAAAQKRLVRASSLFASSVVCGTINGKALANMAQYMAGSAIGYTSKDLNPTKPVEFYQRIARFGAPEALPQFWMNGFRDNAQQKEAEARSAAALEILGTGEKSTQKTDAYGKTAIYVPKDVVAQGLTKAVDSIFGIQESSRATSFNTSSFDAFLKDLTAQIVIKEGTKIAEKFLAQFGIPTPATEVVVKAFVAPVAAAFAVKLMTKLYNHIGEMIFQGEFLAESGGCRKPGKKKTFTQANKVFKTTTDFTKDVDPPDTHDIPEPPDTPEPIPDLIFDATPDSINAGDVVVLSWDGSSLGPDVTLFLSGGPFSQSVEITGGVQDVPGQTTTYTLTATGPNVDITKTVTVTVTNGASGPPSMTFEPGVIETDRVVKVKWDANVPPGPVPELYIEPLSDAALPLVGEACYVPDSFEQTAKQIPFHLERIFPAETVEVNAIVPIVAITPRVFDFSVLPPIPDPDALSTITWDIQGYPGSEIFLNGGPVAASGSLEVVPGIYTLQIREANKCGVIAEQSMIVPGEICGDFVDNDGDTFADEGCPP